MADLTYTVGVETSSAQRNLTTLQERISKVNQSFGGLKTAIAGIGFGAFLASAIQYADALQDIANSTGISTGAILAFGKAVKNNGGEVQQAQQGILKFVQTINDAAEGSAKAQEAFNDVGITLEDLATLSEEDLLKKTIAGLGKIESSSKRLGVTVDLLGKSFRGVDIKGVSSGFSQAASDSAKYTAAISAAAAAQGKLDETIGTFKIALLKALTPLIDFVSKVNTNIDTISHLIEILLYAVGGVLIFTKGVRLLNVVLGAIITPLKAAGGLMEFLGAKAIQLGRNFVGVFVNIGRGIGAIAGGTSTIVSFIAAIGSMLRFVLRFAGIAGVIYAVADAINWLVKATLNIDLFGEAADYIAKFWKELKNLINYSDAASDAHDRLQKALKETSHAARSEQIQKQSAAQREVTDATEKQLKAIGELGKAYQLQNKAIVTSLKSETELLGKSEYAIAMKRAELDVTARNKAEVDKLTQAKINYLNANTDASPKIIAAYDTEIAKIKESLAADIERVKVATDGYQTRVMALDQFAARLEEVTQMEERAAQQGEALTESYKSLVKPIEEANAKMAIRFEMQKSMRGMGEYQIDTMNQVLDIEERQIDALKEIRNNTLLTADAQTVLTERVNAGYNAQIQMIKKNREEQYQYSRQFSTGWTQAFNEYVNAATNAAQRAKDQFGAFTNFVDEAINQMVDNGKINFRSLVDSLIKELLKAELKSAIGSVAGAIGGMGKGGGGGGTDWLGTALSFGKSLLGFADGGNPPVNKPSIVGERGPELFVPKTAGTVIPNGGMGGQTITNTYNTYNISAIDSKSVAQMFSENRRALLGTVQAAQKELPYRAR